MFQNLQEALNALQACRENAEIARCETIIRLEASELRELLSSKPASAGEENPPGPRAAVTREKPRPPRVRGEPSAQAPVAVVFDQMFKRFAEILDRELPSTPLEFHEIIGRGLEAPLRVGPRLYQQPARDDYDVLKLLETLSNTKRLVVFFTGDKRLAGQARSLPGVYVVYLPPGEVSGKEMAIKLMKKEITKALEEAGLGAE